MRAELNANFAAFELRWKAQWDAAELAFRADPIFESAFDRLVSVQAWRSELLENSLSNEAAQFALEGQNDLLTAYIFARTGQWRPALQAQRAAIESYLNALFFMDHPVELTLWTMGRYKTIFSDLIKYFSTHPKLLKVSTKISGIELIKKEYRTLSLAVHGSAKDFRMTKAGGPKYFSDDAAEKSRWVSRNRLVIRGLNLLLLALFADELKGTRKRNLRESISLALQAKDKPWIKTTYQVTIPFL